MPGRFLNGNEGWFETGLPDGPAVSSRIRLARNIAGCAFPDWAGQEECDQIWRGVTTVIQEQNLLPGGRQWAMPELSELDRGILYERHLISREMAGKERGSGVLVGPGEHTALMINEEDHLRLQAIEPGIRLREAYARIDAIDDQLEEHLSYAFSPRLGYLTACPSNVGTGLRASVMLHLPGLVLMNEMGPILNGISKIGLAVRGLWGEGTEAAGNMFQISNQITLGRKEEEIIEHLEQIVLELTEHEQKARGRLLEERRTVLEDYIGRAYGILCHACILNSKEALDLLSAIRLGVDLELVHHVPRREVDRLFIHSQPAHLQQVAGRMLEPEERDTERARLIRSFLMKPIKRKSVDE